MWIDGSSRERGAGRALVAGGAGFIGSHLCRALLDRGYEVLCVDTMLTGHERNLHACWHEVGFRFLRHDVTRPLDEGALAGACGGEGSLDLYLHFRHGAVHAFGRDAPSLVGQTVAVWLLEGARLTCILWALGLPVPGKVGPMAALFLALGSSVLTTLPLTPGGLGFVEPFIFTVLALLGVAGGISTGAAVVVFDRLISYLSIAVIGFLLYAFTDKAHGAPAASPPSSATAR